jgi:choline dehydrogenase
MAAEYDFIVVGSGAGGGPLACNLTLAPEGYRVALLEAGTDPAAVPDSRTFFNCSVPGLHTRATEDSAISWEFFVQHYNAVERQKQDTKYHDDKAEDSRGIFYPRAAAVGGCTAHHAMITLYPHRADWDAIKELTGDDSWSADNMRKYFERLESCQYLPRPATGQDTDPATRHGFDGWLPLSMADPTLAFQDQALLQILLYAFLVAQMEVGPDGKPAGARAQEVLSDSERTKKALGGALQRLLAAGEKAAERMPNSARSMLESVKGDMERLARDPGRPKKDQKELDDPLALLRAYVQDVPSLLQLFQLALAWLDPNRSFDTDAQRVGAFSTPASILHGVRTGLRERILAVRALYPDRLHLITGALVTKVVIENKKAVGVRYLKQEGLYQATPSPWTGALPPARELRVRANGEVILAGGAFNTPQLLMLSGIGESKHLTAVGTPAEEVVCDLPGVGKNLQDRYEVGVVAQLPEGAEFTVLKGSYFLAPGDGCAPNLKAPELRPGSDGPPDVALKEWLNHRGVYASNGAVLTIIKSSSVVEKGGVPDLFIFGLPGNFRGYEKGYSCKIQHEQKKDGSWVENHRRFTWAILKGRTRNMAGVVRLRDTNPLRRPAINFQYFDEGSAEWEKDLQALVDGVRFTEQLLRASDLKAKIIWPEDKDRNGTDALKAFLKREAWGHHACGTCKIGKADDKAAVLDGDFRVRGVKNLRVVDASVFPKIPGFFIVTSIYMISEKASDVIRADRKLADAGKPRDDWPKAPAL